jgi:hypothetical protein
MTSKVKALTLPICFRLPSPNSGTVTSPKSLYLKITSLNPLETFSPLRAGSESLGSGREIFCIPVHYQIDL